MNKKHITYFILYLVILLISLQSFSTYRFVLPPLVILVALHFKYSQKVLIISLALVVFFIINITSGVMINDLAVDGVYVRSAIVSVILSGILWSIFSASDYSFQNMYVKAIEFSLVFNSVFFFIQFILLYSIDYHLDMTLIIMGIEGRISGPPIADFVLWRPSGLTFEPGSYATYIAPLLFLSYLYRKQVTKLHLVVLFTFALSISLYAYLFIFLFFLSASATIIKNNKFFLLMLIMSLLVFSGFVYEYLSWRFFSGRSDLSLNVRFESVDFILNADFLRIFTGSFFGFNDCDCLIRDTSLLFNLFYTFGFLGIVIPISLLVYVNNYVSRILLLAIFLSKIPMFAPIFWFFMFGICILGRRAHENSIHTRRGF